MSLQDQRPVALVGLMGAGKSSVARILGERLQVRVADLDALLEREEGRTIAELFERQGEAAFRRRESEVFERSLGAGAQVLACGGGLVLAPANRARLIEDCRAVWLEVTPAAAARRLAGTESSRPMLRGGPPRERLETLLAERRLLYAEVAIARVLTDGRSAGEVASAVLAELEKSER